MKNDQVQIIELPKIVDSRGNLTVIEELKEIPFRIERVYWIYDVPGGGIRGGHAFRDQHEILVALSGSFDVVTHDGSAELRFSMNRSYYGLYLPPMTWRTIENFSTNAICLVVSSHLFFESDYMRDFKEFSKQKRFSVKKPEVPMIKTIEQRQILEKPTIYDSCILQFPKIVSGNGHISVVQSLSNLPYSIRRVYFLYDIPASSERGGHSHRKCHRLLVSISGAFEVTIDDGWSSRTVRLDRPYYGLYIPPGLWSVINAFSGGANCLSIVSHSYDENDYIRDYELFIREKAGGNT